MYHPSSYESHNEALLRFIDVFNMSSKKFGSEVEMYYQEKENFRDDGGIIHIESSEKILYDFEKRKSYYPSCDKFKFKNEGLGQFERKIQKPEIELSIQCCTDESCFMVAWHEDLKNEKKVYLNSQTENGKGERNAKRFTMNYVEIKYSDMDTFYKIVLNAFKQQNFNKKSFLLIDSPKGKYKKALISDVEYDDLIILANHKNSKYKEIASEEIIRRNNA